MAKTRGFGSGLASSLAVGIAVKPVVRGREYLTDLPGPFVFVANHPSELDAPLLREALRTLTPKLAIAQFEARGGLEGLADRARGLRSAGRLAALLGDGVSVALFPEKRRADDGSMTEFDLGAAQLGIRAGAPIVPVSIVGSFKAQPPWRNLPESGRPQVTIVFGKPIQTTPGDEPSAVNSRIVDAITLGLAEANHGWYAALRAQADGTVEAELDRPESAHWLRVWKATKPDPETRRKVWV